MDERDIDSLAAYAAGLPCDDYFPPSSLEDWKVMLRIAMRHQSIGELDLLFALGSSPSRSPRIEVSLRELASRLNAHGIDVEPPSAIPDSLPERQFTGFALAPLVSPFCLRILTRASCQGALPVRPTLELTGGSLASRPC